MVRRGICIVVLLGYLVGQVVVVPHAHVGQSADDRGSLMPHVHLSVCGICHHHHREGDDHHEHVAHDHSSVDKFHGDRMLAADDDHDADAVYVPCVMHAMRRTADTNIVDVKGQSQTALSSNLAIDKLVLPLASSSSHYGGIAGRHCALYLTLSCLRI